MSDDLEFTGERFVPGITGEIAHEHWHRYAFARRHVAGRRVLDVACGEGYGSALLAEVAAQVTGIDIAEDAIARARIVYAARPNLRFDSSAAAALPLPDGAVDVVVSFETIEHLPAVDQPRMLAEIARVLAPNGLLLLSSPNPVEYSDARGYRNPFHLHEPPREELDALLAIAFQARRWYRQRRYFGSALWSEDATGCVFEAWSGDAVEVVAATPPAAMYHVVLAAKVASALPPSEPALSLFSDGDESELRRIDARESEILRLDGLLGERDAALDRQTGHIIHLEELVVHRDRVVAERDSQLAASEALRNAMSAERDRAVHACAEAQRATAAFSAECGRLERALTAQERIIAYRQSARWWLELPWLRLRLWWQHVRGT
ncbi:MAG: class I SAM-dependent methyltransferase [Burkholderiales bacterium]|nr:class I SAM-dependent methyltransferase [Burkholderiales bacterium]